MPRDPEQIEQAVLQLAQALHDLGKAMVRFGRFDPGVHAKAQKLSEVSERVCADLQ
jgi:hypothetical protein